MTMLEADDTVAEMSIVARIMAGPPESGLVYPTQSQIDDLTARMLRLPDHLKVDVATWNGTLKHHWAPGVYMRDGVMPAGCLIVGHTHRHAHFNIVLSGCIAVLMEGKLSRFQAGDVVLSRPGVQKIGITLAATRWLTVHPRAGLEHLGEDGDAIFNELMEPSKVMVEYQREEQQRKELEHAQRPTELA